MLLQFTFAFAEHVHSSLCIHEIYLYIHAKGVPEGVTLLEFEGARQEEEQEQLEEPEVPASEESVVEELPECPDHRPSSFLNGKPRCILIQHVYQINLSTFILFIALSGRS
jgi:hypothetical protein